MLFVGECSNLCSYVEQKTYNSFAPIRTNQLCKWFLNASAYMENVMYAINYLKEKMNLYSIEN